MPGPCRPRPAGRPRPPGTESAPDQRRITVGARRRRGSSGSCLAENLFTVAPPHGCSSVWRTRSHDARPVPGAGQRSSRQGDALHPDRATDGVVAATHGGVDSEEPIMFALVSLVREHPITHSVCSRASSVGRSTPSRGRYRQQPGEHAARPGDRRPRRRQLSGRGRAADLGTDDFAAGRRRRGCTLLAIGAPIALHVSSCWSTICSGRRCPRRSSSATGPRSR